MPCSIKRRVLCIWPDGTWTDPIIRLDVPFQGDETERIDQGVELLFLRFPYNGCLDMRDWGNPDHEPAKRDASAVARPVEHISCVPDGLRRAGSYQGHEQRERGAAAEPVLDEESGKTDLAKTHISVRTVEVG